MVTKEESTKIVDFITLGAGVNCAGACHLVNMQYLFSSSCQH